MHDPQTESTEWENGDAERLKLYVYGITKPRREDLTVSEGERTEITVRGSGAKRWEHLAHRVPIQTVDDLKRVIGIPDQVARDHCRCPEGLVEAFPPGFDKISDLSSNQRDQLRAATDAYVHGNSALVAHYAPTINRALSMVDKSRVVVVLFQDIIVERNAVLTVSPSLDVLFANKVMIKLGGRIRFTSRLKIDCSSIEGEERFVSVTPILAAQAGVATAAAAGGGQ